MRAALLCALLALAASCSVTMDLPQDFLRLETTGDLKAVSGDDARIWVREFETPDEAPLAFWVEALRHDLVQQRGYDLIAEGDVEDGDGRAGRWFECAANVRGERIGYLIAVWTRADTVRVAEFAARAEVFAARRDAIRKAFATVRS